MELKDFKVLRWCEWYIAGNICLSIPKSYHYKMQWNTRFFYVHVLIVNTFLFTVINIQSHVIENVENIIMIVTWQTRKLLLGNQKGWLCHSLYLTSIELKYSEENTERILQHCHQILDACNHHARVTKMKNLQQESTTSAKIWKLKIIQFLSNYHL